MASQTNNIGTTAMVIFIFTLFMILIFFISGDVSQKNTKLDTQSEELIKSLGNEYKTNYNKTEYFNVPSNNITDNSTFQGVDAFSRQYLEDKSEITQKKSTLEAVILFPSLLLVIFGVSDMALLIIFSALVYGIISFLLGLQIYKAIRTGEVD